MIGIRCKSLRQIFSSYFQGSALMIVRWQILIILWFVFLLLAACGGDNGDQTEATIFLPQSVSIDVGALGTLTAHYPAGWVGEAGEGTAWLPLIIIGIATNQALLDGQEPEYVYRPGEMAVAIFPGNAEEEGVSPAEAITQQLETAEGTGSVSEVESFDAGGHPAAIVTVTALEDNPETGQILIVVDLDVIMASMLCAMPAAEVEARIPLARALAAALEFVPATTE